MLWTVVQVVILHRWDVFVPVLVVVALVLTALVRIVLKVRHILYVVLEQHLRTVFTRGM